MSKVYAIPLVPLLNTRYWKLDSVTGFVTRYTHLGTTEVSSADYDVWEQALANPDGALSPFADPVVVSTDPPDTGPWVFPPNPPAFGAKQKDPLWPSA